MTPINAIYLDLDGVLADFVTAALGAHGKPGRETIMAWPPGEYDLCTVMDIAEEAFWSVIDDKSGGYGSAPGRFWSEDVYPYEWRDLLWNFCEERVPTWILSSPARDAGSSFGKIRWLQKWKGETFRQYVLAPNKVHLARPGALLIDDDQTNCARWIENGGDAILFPRKWNGRHERHDRPIETIIPELLGRTFATRKGA